MDSPAAQVPNRTFLCILLSCALGFLAVHLEAKGWVALAFFAWACAAVLFGMGFWLLSREVRDA